jgi:hypothetical protein
MRYMRVPDFGRRSGFQPDRTDWKSIPRCAIGAEEESDEMLKIRPEQMETIRQSSLKDVKGGTAEHSPPAVTCCPTPVVVRLTSPGIDDARKKSHGAPVMLNDDFDNHTLYGPNPPAGHRELEPVFDLDSLEDAPLEDDLLRVTLELSPSVSAGRLNLSVVEGDKGMARIRLWPTAFKGRAADVIKLPANIAVSSLPRDFFVEGLQTGQATLEAVYTHAGQTSTDRIAINVVELQESQGAKRRVIYDYNTDIEFEVVGAPNNYTFDWDLDGDGSFNSAVFEKGRTTAKVKCKYGPVQDANTVLLPQTAATRRQVFDVAVRVTGGLVLHVKGTTFENLTVRKGMRVALATNQGAPLPAPTTAGLQTLFAWSDTNPVGFDPLNPPDPTHSGANRISFNAALTANAQTAIRQAPAPSIKPKVCFVEVGPQIWTSGQKREDLVATVNHEQEHLKQSVQMRDNNPPNNVWFLLNQYYGGGQSLTGKGSFRNFFEAGGELTELEDVNVSWFHQLPGSTQGDLTKFHTFFDGALNDMANISHTATKSAARELLQDMYSRLPFFEMKRPGYDHFVRPPP